MNPEQSDARMMGSPIPTGMPNPHARVNNEDSSTDSPQRLLLVEPSAK